MFSFSGPSCSIFHFPPDIFLDKCYDRSLLNSFWNSFLVFPPPLYLYCVCVRETVTCSKSRTKSPTDTAICYLTQPFINYLSYPSFLIAHCFPFLYFLLQAPCSTFFTSTALCCVICLSKFSWECLQEKERTPVSLWLKKLRLNPLKPNRLLLELRGRESRLVAARLAGRIYVLFNPSRNV